MTRRRYHDHLIQQQERGWCNWCGKVQNTSIGTLDHEKGEIISKSINENRNEMVILHNEIINQITLFQATLKLSSKNMDNVQTEFNEIAKQLQDINSAITKESNRAQLAEKILTLTLIATSAMDERYQVQSQLTRAISDAKNHKISDFIETETLAVDIRSIAAYLKPTQRLPEDLRNEAVLQVFKYAEVSSILINNKLLIEINISIPHSRRRELLSFPCDTSAGKNANW